MESKRTGSPATSAAASQPGMTAAFLAVAGTAEELGFMRAPEPDCLGRADTACSASEGGEHDHGDDHHDHDHDHDHGDDHHEHGDGHHEHGGAGVDEGGDEPAHAEHEGGHEHMRVFPVFTLVDDEVVEVVNEEGEVTEGGQRAQKPARPAKGGKKHNGTHK